ncbi:ribonucleotide reductase subunit A [Cyanophage S-RIM14]|nr:ribonucleotide reductase subunit A [Cyanophage S-RIM14]AOO13510.1 ribonucleotide reductase subunit A [Cyanophage S-RIM14]AOO13726.1 ribonucleotide reductase subunit A [Cyanophage S-RIM14]AOO13942.1 ribonucleotide reductase subunit A [Cyanophage S-RIM14]AOO14158.1 ribonucleotide reductase subunit A [Cyanophage S-RIM14]
MSNGIKVVKRDGVEEPINLEKIHKMVEHACYGLASVSASQVEINSGIQFYDGIKTSDIQEILIRSANDLISLDNPNYQFVAARLLLFGLRKSVYGVSPENHPKVEDQLSGGIESGVYDQSLIKAYSSEEFAEMDSYMDHDRDMLFTYAGLRQVVDKYLVQDRSSGKIYETPQYMYMLIAATLFQKYPQETRLDYVRRYYNAISKHQINIPTPVMAGVRTPLRQFASCVLVDVDDTLDSIFSSDMAIGYYVAQRAGIGINAGRIRGINSKIRGGEVQHTGVIPFLKKFESTVRCCTQNGIRGGSATVHFPIWHSEIEDIIVLKNNKGTEDNRVRKLDYSIQISKLFYERFIANGEISLFSPNDVPGLYDAFGTDAFDACYVDYESDQSVPRKIVNAQELVLSLLKERAETGRLYLMNIDHCNSHSSFKDKVNMSNLCQEITLPTDPINHINDDAGEIALCILSAINVGKLKTLDEMETLCDLAVRGLEELIDYQDYPVDAARRSTLARRSLGIGYIGLAHYLAKRGLKYSAQEALSEVHDLTEAFQYYLLRASNKIAQEKGPCQDFGRTKYSDGVLPIDSYKKDVDALVSPEYNYDWDSLRSDITTYGLRHSTLSAQMPSESSSVVSNATNGIEPPRDYLSIKKSKKGPLKQIVPQYNSLKNNYTLLWDMESNKGYIEIVAVIQKFFDQAISGNWSYNPEQYPDNEVPVSVMANDFLNTYKYGWKTSYYQNTYDAKKDGDEIETLIQELLETEEEDCDSCKV